MDTNLYERALDRMAHDDRLTCSERLFLLYLIRHCDTSGKCHMTMRELKQRTNISVGAISDGIPRLIEYGYIRGSLYPNERGHESWLLYLADPPGPGQEPCNRPPLAQFQHRYDGKLITVMIEDDRQ